MYPQACVRRKPDLADCSQPLDVSQNRPGSRRSRRRAKPSQGTVGACFSRFQQPVKLRPALRVQTVGQQREYLSLRPGRRFGAEPFDDRHRRQHDAPVAQFLHYRPCQNQTSGGLQSGRFQPCRQGAIMRRRKLLHSHAWKQFGQMFSAGFVPRCIQFPCGWSNRELSGYEFEYRLVWRLLLAQHPSRILEVAHLHGDAETIVVAAMLPDESQIRFGQRVQANQFTFVFWES